MSSFIDSLVRNEKPHTLQKLESFLKDAAAALDQLKKAWLLLLPGETISASEIRETLAGSAPLYRAALETADGVTHTGEGDARLGIKLS